MGIRYLFLSLLICNFLVAQTEYLDYRSVTNPLYWKNRKPIEGYWQQDVHYNIKANLNDSTDIISGEEELTYWNNSPTPSVSFIFIYTAMLKPKTHMLQTYTKTTIII